MVMSVYTDPRLLDVHGAIESLPQIVTTSEPSANKQRMAAGAETFFPSAVAVPTDFSGDSQSTAFTLDAFPTDADFGNSLGCNTVATNEKRSLSRSNSERSRSEAGGTRTRNLRIDSLREQGSKSEKPQRVTKRRSLRGSSGGSSSPGYERDEAVGGSVSSRADTLPIKADSFSAALAMIASLPLSDAEKADTVRRLMAEQAIAQPPKLMANALSASDERDRSQTGGRA